MSSNNPWDQFSEITTTTRNKQSSPWDQFSNVVEPGNANQQTAKEASSAPPLPKQPEPGYNVLGGLADLGKSLYDVPTQLKGAVGSLVEGGELPSANKGWDDTAIEAASQRSLQRQQALGEQAKEKVLPFLTRGDISNFGQNLATSLVGMGAGLAAGLPAALATTPVGGMVAGGAASGAAAYRMSQNQFIRQGLDAANQKAIRETGRGLTPEQEKTEYDRLTPLAQKYGTWEAVPEAISNVIGFGVGKEGVKQVAKQGVMKPLAKFLGVQLPTETGTEAVTQMGQSNIEVDAGLSNEPKRDFTSPADWWKSVKEVFPQTFMLTALMGGAGAVGTKMLGSKQDAETNINPSTERLAEQPVEQMGASGLTEKQIRDAERIQNPLSPFAHSSPVAEKQVIDKGNIVVFPDQDNEAVYPVLARNEDGSVVIGTSDFDENGNQITVNVPRETSERLLVVNTESWQQALEAEQPAENANLPFQATSGQLPVPVVPITEQGWVDQNIPAINQTANPGRIDLLNPANNELATPVTEQPAPGSEFTRRTAPATLFDELNRLTPEQRESFDAIREQGILSTPAEQRTPADSAFLAMRRREAISRQPKESGLILPEERQQATTPRGFAKEVSEEPAAQSRIQTIPQRIDLLQGNDNAIENYVSGQIDGRSSAQPEVRQEGGGSTESSQGIQLQRSGNEVAQQGNETAQGQITPFKGTFKQYFEQTTGQPFADTKRLDAARLIQLRNEYQEAIKSGKPQSAQRSTQISQEKAQEPQTESSVISGPDQASQGQKEITPDRRWNALLVNEKEIVLRSIGYKPEVARRLSTKNWEDLSKAHQNKLVAAQTGARSEEAIQTSTQVQAESTTATLPAKPFDARLTRKVYRDALEGAASELVKGGGLAYIRDENNVIVGRTPSVNPAWFQELAANPETSLSTDKAKKAVNKALNGEKLGVREAKAVSFILDTIRQERTSYDNVAYVKEQLEKARALRRDAVAIRSITEEAIGRKAEADQYANSAGEKFNEQDYLEYLDGETRALAELMLEADEAGLDYTSIGLYEETKSNAGTSKTSKGATGGVEEKSADFALKTQTEEELTKKDQEIKVAKAAEERAFKEQDKKKAADKERNQFELTGSSRKADQSPRQLDLTSKKSEAVTKPSIGGHIDKIKTSLKRDLGTDRFSDLMSNADFSIIQSVKDLPDAVKKNLARQNVDANGAMGLWDNSSDQGRAKIFLIADNIAKPEFAYKVLLHEVGVHYGFAEMVGKDTYKQIINELKAADQKGVKWVRNIADLVRKLEPRAATNDALLYEEVMAYAVQYMPNQPIATRIIAAIRKFLRSIGIVKAVKPDDLVYIATGALQHAIDGKNVFAISERSIDRLKDISKGSYAGVYAELANTGKLQEALKRSALGDDSEIVRQETGWFKGPDGKWKFEISDNNATLKIKPEDMAIGRKYDLPDILDHADLLENYPDLRDIKVKSQLMFSNEKGSFDNKTKTIELNAELNPKKALSVLLHEIQHWIQYREDFATGGAPTIESLGKVIDQARPYFSSLMERSDKMLAERMASDDVAMRDSAMDYYRQNQKLVEAYDSLLTDVKSGQKTPAQLSRQADGSGVLFRIYEILAGEVEARDVQNRRALTPEQRKQQKPYSSEGIPADQLVIKKADAVSMFSQAVDVAEKAIKAERKGLRSRALDFANRISSPLSGLPDEDQYRLSRYLTMGKIGESMQRARDFFDAFQKASKEDAEAAYEFLTDKGIKPQIIKDETVRAKAVEAKALFAALGDVAVQKGLIPKESYEQYKDAYLPRIYLRHLLDEQSRVDFASTGKKPGLGWSKKRKDIPEHVRRLVLGEIKDPGYLVAHGVGNELKDIAIIGWLEEISKNPNWVLPNQLIEWDGHKVTPFWLISEANTIRQIAVNYQGQQKEEALDLADKMDQTGRAALPELPEIPNGWKKFPNNARYGKLRGLVVKKQIYDDIVGTVKVTEDQSIAQRVLGDDGLLAKGTSFWKFMKVAANPASQIRNAISNLFMTHLFGGVNFHMILPRLVQAAKEINNKGELYQYLMQYGGGESSFASKELRRVNTEFLTALAKMDGKSWTQLRLAFGKFENKLSDIYQNMETLSKLMVIIDQTAKGATPEQAVLAAHHALLDYSDVSPSVRYLRNAPIGTPFITFNIKALGNLIETLIQHPMRFAPYAAMPFLLTSWFAASADVDKEDVKKLQETLSERMRTTGSVYFLPYKDENGRWQTMDVGYFFPYTQWVDALQYGLKGDAFKAAESFGLLGGPVPDIISAVKTGIDPFTDKPIANPSDPPAVQIGAILDYAWRLAMPTFLTNMGVIAPSFQGMATGEGYTSGKLSEAITGRLDRQSGVQKATIPQALLKLVGANINPVDPQLSRANNIKIMQRSIQDTKSRMTYLLRDPGLSAEQRSNLSEAYRNEIKEKSEKLREYVASSVVNPKLTKGLTKE